MGAPEIAGGAAAAGAAAPPGGCPLSRAARLPLRRPVLSRLSYGKAVGGSEALKAPRQVSPLPKPPQIFFDSLGLLPSPPRIRCVLLLQLSTLTIPLEPKVRCS